MTWMGDTLAPTAPTSLYYKDGILYWKSHTLSNSPCEGEDGRGPLYNIYGSNTYPVDVTKAENLLAARVTDTQWQLNARAQKVRHYAVTAMDRLGNESPAAQEEKPTIELPEHINVPRLINRDLKGASKATGKKNKKTKKKRT